MTISQQILLRMRNALAKVVEKINTHFMFNKIFSENRTLYKIMSNNVVSIEGPQMTSQHGAYALHTG
jgi:hypothetical protein